MPMLFSYGTLQLADIQQSVFGRLLSGEPDELVGYERGIVEIDDVDSSTGRQRYAIVTFNGKLQSRVLGTVFEVSEDELSRADRYEPEPYKRVTATLASGKQSWVYVDARPCPQPPH